MPHPDDESYSVAGTLALATRSGADVTLVTATRGGAGWVRDAARFGDRPLADIREDELCAACHAIGIGPAHILGWPDGELDSLDRTDARDRLRSLLAVLEPDVVLTLAADGVYGHRDHVCLTQLCLDIGRLDQVRVLLADFPVGLFAPFASRFLEYGREFLVEDVEPHTLGIDTDCADLVVSLDRQAADAKRAALACHTSQLVSDDPVTFLFPGLVERVCASEWYIHAAGPTLPAGATSPFAGLP